MGPCEGFNFKTGCPGHESEQLGVLGGGEADKHAATFPVTAVALEFGGILGSASEDESAEIVHGE
jgi:hypothetical protein